MPGWAQGEGWEKKWNEIVGAAKKEGKVVVFGTADPKVRLKLPSAFNAKFGISVEYLSGRTRQAAARLRSERRARHYTIDVFMSGTGTFSTILYPGKMLDPLRPTLILPDVYKPEFSLLPLRAVPQ